MKLQITGNHTSNNNNKLDHQLALRAWATSYRSHVSKPPPPQCFKTNTVLVKGGEKIKPEI